MANDENRDGPRRIMLVTADPQLAAMARGAMASGDDRQLSVLEKSIHDVAGEIRDTHCDCLVVDIDAANVTDFEQLQKIKRMIGASIPVIVISSGFSQAAARILIQLKVADFPEVCAAESVVELCDGSAARMTLRVRGDSTTLVALAESFWRRRR